MNYENVLLIGGPRDGEWISVIEGIPTIRMVKPPAEIGSYSNTPDNAQITYETLEYVRVPFESRKGVKGAVFTYGDVDLLTTLIDGYRKS